MSYYNKRKVHTVYKVCALDKYAKDIIINEEAGTLTIKGDLAAHGINDVIVNDDVDVNINDGCNLTITAEVNISVGSGGDVIAENLKAENIKKGVTILGITGTYEG